MSTQIDSGEVLVLVVDLDDRTLDYLNEGLEDRFETVRCIEARTVEDALDRVHREQVDCVVSGYDLPESDGLSLLEAVRAADSALPFVLFTADDRGSIASQAILADVTDYVVNADEGAGGPESQADEPYDRLVDGVAETILEFRARESPGRILEETRAQITALSEFAQDVSTSESIEEVLQLMVDGAEEILAFETCATSRLDDDQLVPVAISSGLDLDAVRTYEVGEGITGRTIERGETIVVDDVTDNDVAKPVSNGIRSVISVPIGAHGTFQAAGATPNAFDRTDVELVELLASHASEAIERIETEASLRAERDRLAALFENLPQPAARVKILDDGIELDRSNDAYERTFGFTAKNHTQDRFRTERVPEDEPPLEPTELYRRGEPTQVDVRRITTNGTRPFRLTAIPVDSGDERLLYAVYTDIEEQKRIERTLGQLHDATREMFRDDDPEAIAAITARTAIDVLGFPTSGVRLYDAESNTLEPTAISEEAEAIIGDRPPFGPGDDPIWTAYEEARLVRIDDTESEETAVDFGALRSNLIVPIREHGVMLFGSESPDYFDDSDEYLARILGANAEVALDRASQTRKLKQRDERLRREVDRLEKFAAILSHDLRNPLSIATGNLELARRLCECSATEQHFDEIESGHDRMTQLIEDLLSLARDGRTVDETEPVELGRIAKRAWQTVETADATLAVVDGGTTIQADSERLLTLFENLFRNSVEHGGPDVEVVVESLADGDGFAVADDGVGLGVDPDEAFTYGVSGDKNGTGFGLAIVREIAEAHGWTVEAEAAESGGARFVFETG